MVYAWCNVMQWRATKALFIRGTVLFACILRADGVHIYGSVDGMVWHLMCTMQAALEKVFVTLCATATVVTGMGKLASTAKKAAVAGDRNGKSDNTAASRRIAWCNQRVWN